MIFNFQAKKPTAGGQPGLNTKSQHWKTYWGNFRRQMKQNSS